MNGVSMGRNAQSLFQSSKEKHVVQNRVRKLIVKVKEITDPKEISNKIKVFYETLFKQNSAKSNVEKQEFLNSLDIKTLSDQQANLCKNEIRVTDLLDSMESMKNNGNDGLAKTFYKTF